MSFTAKVENINKNKQGGVYKAEKFMNETNRLYKLIELQLKSMGEQKGFYLKVNDEQVAFSLDSPDNLSFDDAIGTKDDAFIQQITEQVKSLKKFEAQIIAKDFDAVQKTNELHGKALQELNALLSQGGITLQTEEDGKTVVLFRSPKIDTNISVDENTKMTNCIITKVENKKSAWVITFDGYRGRKKCKAELIFIETSLSEKMCKFMINQQRLNIEVCYKKTINDKTCKKIKGTLLAFDKALTQVNIPINL